MYLNKNVCLKLRDIYGQLNRPSGNTVNPTVETFQRSKSVEIKRAEQYWFVSCKCCRRN